MPQISINSLLSNTGPSYPEERVAPFRQELEQAGFEQLMTAEAVDAALDRQDDQVVAVALNSVCGCSARVGRPGAILSLMNEKVPDRLVTIFAGMEKDAVSRFREKYMAGITPSSPNIALFKNGQLLHILHRHQIERMEAGVIADDLIAAYNAACSKHQTAEERERLRQLFIQQYQVDPFQLPTE